nr:choice-of-anchor tandem repeat GloVer-containing protein [Solimonas soli]
MTKHWGVMSTAQARRARPPGRLAAAVLFALGAAAAWTPARADDDAFTVLHSFSQLVDGALPVGIVRASDGNFYGTTSVGGSGGVRLGTVFRYTAAGDYRVLHTFADTADGHGPDAGVIEGGDGALYGTTVVGGASDKGTVFRIGKDGTTSLLHSFDGSDGEQPHATVMQASDGNFYGTTSKGGAKGLGTVFRLTPAGALTLLHSFSGDDGQTPYGDLVQGDDGTLYGTTYQGGAHKLGTVFRIAADGSGYALLHSFSGPPDALGPQSGLVKAADGSFYGTAGGGPTGYGIVYRITAAGTLSVLHALDGHAEGGLPIAKLLIGADGALYGTASQGGDDAGDGTVFRVTPSGTFAVLHTFDGDDGRWPQAVLAQGSDGLLYGAAYSGGANGDGTLFRVAATAGDVAVVATPVLSPAGGSFTAAQSVTITDATTGAAIHYSTDGSTPTGASALYTGPITIASTTTLKAIATASGYQDSAVITATYTIATDAGSGPGSGSGSGSGGGAIGLALLLPLLAGVLARRRPR